ncbi:MAG: hypothetical protein ACLUFD_08515 [Faecalibacterium sp.]|jgi:hypothetical protein|nr:MAG TPA: Protein of unknown function (DUF1492) [Caudoviricetes sp.]
MTRTWIPDTDTPKTDGGADYRTVKAWFQQCRDLAEQVEAQKQKIQRIRDTAEKCTQSMSGMPAGGGASDKVGFAVERIDTEERNLKQMELDLCELRTEAARRAYCLSGSARARKQADCIYDYYVQNLCQRKIAESVSFKNVNAVSVYIREGMEALAEIWKNIQTDQ